MKNLIEKLFSKPPRIKIIQTKYGPITMDIDGLSWVSQIATVIDDIIEVRPPNKLSEQQFELHSDGNIVVAEIGKSPRPNKDKNVYATCHITECDYWMQFMIDVATGPASSWTVGRAVDRLSYSIERELKKRLGIK